VREGSSRFGHTILVMAVERPFFDSTIREEVKETISERHEFYVDLTVVLPPLIVDQSVSVCERLRSDGCPYLEVRIKRSLSRLLNLATDFAEHRFEIGPSWSTG